MSFIETAYAMAPQAGGGAEGNMFASLMPFALIFLVFYFLLIRPQQKKAKEHKKMLSELQKGDAIVTAGGLYGRIIDIDGDIMTVDLGETKVTMGRGYLTAAPQVKVPVPPVKKEKKGKKEKDAPRFEAAAVVEAEESSVPEGAEAEESAGEAKADDAPVISGQSDTDKPAVQ